MIATQQDASNEVLAVISAANTSAAQLAEIFTQAINYQQAGQLLEAEKLYLQILEVEPFEPNVNYNLGALHLESNQTDISLAYFKAALEADQNEPQYWVSYIDALIKAGQQNPARELLTKGLELGLHGDAVNALVNQLCMPQAIQQPINKTQPNTTKTNSQIQQATALMRAGKLKQAKEKYTKLLKLLPKHHQILTGLGTIALRQGDINEGISLLEQSLASDSNQVIALSNLGIGYTFLKRFNQAIECCDLAIAINPSYADAHSNRGNALKDIKRFDEAIVSYKEAIKLNPDNADNHFNLGFAFEELKQFKDAALSFQRVIALNPIDAEAHVHCGAVLLELKLLDDALFYCNRAIELNKNNSVYFCVRGLVLLELRQYEEAKIDFEQSIKLNVANLSAHHNLSVVCLALSRYEQALDASNAVIELDPSYVQAYANRATAFQGMNRLDDALAENKIALSIDSTIDSLYWNKSIIKLLAGDYLEGWELYEWRWKAILKEFYRVFAQPLWLGEQSIAGKTLLIYPEQGFGDFIQFCRYVPMVEALGAKVILEVPKALTSLISTLKGNFTIVEKGMSLPDFDFHCPIMSLPLAFKTTATNIPAPTPYLYADETWQKNWQKKLGTKTKSRVGLVWSGSSTYKNDHRRSIPFETLKPLFLLPVEFHVLQKEISDCDMDALAEFNQIKTHQDALTDFSETAALIQAMDLVITVDTSVAHLASAMGKACWILLPFAPDFRWMLDRTDSPWYPTATLFRQPDYQDWQSVIDQVKRGLEANCVS